MAESWQPDLASEPLEKLMEQQDVPETDRDELRRFSEFLQRRKEKKDGKLLAPAPAGMKEWLLGETKPKS